MAHRIECLEKIADLNFANEYDEKTLDLLTLLSENGYLICEADRTEQHYIIAKNPFAE